VLGIIVALSILAIPAISSRKSANDVTKAATTLKGVLDQARAYAQANNTYTWVGFYEEDGSIPSVIPAPATCTGCAGRLVISVVASTDGTDLGAEPGAAAKTIPATSLTQVTNLVKIDNVHLPLVAVPSPTPNCGNVDCTTFDNRPPVQYDPGSVGYNDSRFGEINGTPPNIAPYTNNGVTLFPFQYPAGGSTAPTQQYFFQRTIRFSPTGENRINSTYDARTLVEIGLLQTRGNVVPTPTSGGGTSTAIYPGNVAAVQIGGLDGVVRIYKR